jgi:penicillin-binding protein activator
MVKRLFTKQYALLPMLLLFVLSGCVVLDEKKEPPGKMINGKFISDMSDKMMRSLLNCKVMANSKKVPRIALLRFRNKSRFPLDGSIFLAKLRADLASKAKGRIIFLARSYISAIKSERSGKRKGVFSFIRGSLKQAISGADYFLTGKMQSITGADNKGNRCEYILFTFYLVDSENSDILWEDLIEVEFEGTAIVVYK